MACCKTCGNEYDKAFQVTVLGQSHTFDSFECAIHTLAQHVRTVAARWSVTESKRTESSMLRSRAHISGVYEVHDRA